MTEDRIETPGGLLHRQLCVAMTMEHDSLNALGELEQAASGSEAKQLFRHHADETREQIDNLRSVFTLLELREQAAPSPSTKGMSTQTAELLAHSASGLHDRIALAGALGNEHYEIAAYQALILPTAVMKATEAERLLTANLEQERHTSEEIRQLLTSILED